MYSIKNKFFYEILDDYKNCMNKDEIFDGFCRLIWTSNNKRIVFKNYISFNVDNRIDDFYKDIFNKYRDIPYMDYRRTCHETDFVSLLRQKLNNIYSLNCDKRIYHKKDYMDKLKYPKNMYFKFLHGDEDILSLEINELDTHIKQILISADEIKSKYVNGKILIGWNQYINLMNGFMRKCFDNYTPLNQSENKDEFVLDTDLWIDDNYCVKYFCKSLDRYFKNYEKVYFGVRRGHFYKKCTECGGLVELSDKKSICNLCIRYKAIGVKYLRCCDCGNEFEVDGIVKKQIRCPECYKIYRNNYQKELMRKRKFSSLISNNMSSNH